MVDFTEIQGAETVEKIRKKTLRRKIPSEYHQTNLVTPRNTANDVPRAREPPGKVPGAPAQIALSWKISVRDRLTDCSNHGIIIRYAIGISTATLAKILKTLTGNLLRADRCLIHSLAVTNKTTDT